jgi:hypothetical protein
VDVSYRRYPPKRDLFAEVVLWLAVAAAWAAIIRQAWHNPTALAVAAVGVAATLWGMVILARR